MLAAKRKALALLAATLFAGAAHASIPREANSERQPRTISLEQLLEEAEALDRELAPEARNTAKRFCLFCLASIEALRLPETRLPAFDFEEPLARLESLDLNSRIAYGCALSLAASCLEKTISADPMGYTDGPNAYAYAGNDPSNSSDPLGLYEADVHFMLTLFLARSAGMSTVSASLVAAADVGVDQSAATSPTVNAVLSKWDTVIAFHFAIDPTSHKVEPNGPVARAGLSVSTSVYELGRALHLFQDSFSHGQAYVGNMSDQKKKYGGMRKRALGAVLVDDEVAGIGHPDIPEIGSTFSNHNADQTWRRPDLGRRMAKETFLALVAEGRRLGVLEREPAAWSSIQEEVEQFLWASTKRGKKNWAQRCLEGLLIPEEIWDDMSIDE